LALALSLTFVKLTVTVNGDMEMGVKVGRF
jgi:hypothetical protein